MGGLLAALPATSCRLPPRRALLPSLLPCSSPPPPPPPQVTTPDDMSVAERFLEEAQAAARGAATPGALAWGSSAVGWGGWAGNACRAHLLNSLTHSSASLPTQTRWRTPAWPTARPTPPPPSAAYTTSD